MTGIAMSRIEEDRTIISGNTTPKVEPTPGREQNLSSPSDLEEEEGAEARYERLGRERPAKFKSAWTEVCFVFSIVMSQILTV